MLSRPSRCALCLAAILLLAPAVYAQGGFGAIRGSIKDSSGAIVPGAKIAAVEISTGTRNDALTDAEGNFLFPRLKPSIYQITAEASGFKKLDRKGIELRVSDSLTLDFIEEFRPLVVDRTVLGLANKNVAFEYDENKILTKETRRMLADKINERLDAESSYEGKRHPIRSILQMQARHLATFLRGERATYEPLVMAW